MQEQHINELTDDLAKKLVPHIQPEGEDGFPQVRDKVAAAIAQVVAENKLLSLPLDEQECLIAYRLWKNFSSAVTGVFHFKRKMKAPTPPPASIPPRCLDHHLCDDVIPDTPRKRGRRK